MAKRGKSANPFSGSMSFKDYELEEWDEEEEEEEVEEEEDEQPQQRTRATRRAAPKPPRINPEHLSQRANTPSGLPAPRTVLNGKRGHKPVLPPAPVITPSRVRAESRTTTSRSKPTVAPVKSTPALPNPIRSTAPASPKAEATRGRRRGKTQANDNPATSTSTSSSSTYPSTAPTAPYGYSSLYSSASVPSTSASAQQTPPKNKLIPALRSAGTRKMERGEARSVDQGTALEIVGKLIGRNVTINDVEKDKKTSGLALFAPPTELVTLFELAMRMVESHQFYSRTV